MTPEPLGPNNPRIQRLRRLLGRRSSRRDEGAYVIEGPTLVAEAAAAGIELEVFVEESARELLPRLPSHASVTPVRDGVLAKVGSTEAPQPIMAVAALVPASIADLAGAAFVLVAAAVGDPGNLGTMLRSAEAAGAAGLVTTTGSVDPWNPKCVRASAGALFHVRVVDGVAPAELRSLGIALVGAVATGGVPYTEPGALAGPLALVLGSEAHGIPADVPIDRLVTIPHAGRAESLNVAMAAAVLSFEVARRRGG
jgi:TrmH family RNA methyltransferase